MTNTFSIAVSKALKKIGVEEWTGERFSTLDDCGMETEPMLPKYTLHDILRLMPKIGGKMGWDEGKLEDESFGWSGNPALWMWQHQSHRLLDAFLEGDYEKAEQYLMSIITKDHEK